MKNQQQQQKTLHSIRQQASHDKNAILIYERTTSLGKQDTKEIQI